MKVYLILLGHQFSGATGSISGMSPPVLLDQLAGLIADNRARLNHIFNPEFHFTFGPQILCQVGQLLQSFNLESYILSYGKSGTPCSKRIRTLQILAQIVYEAL